jgi:hypothetical protein
MSAERTGDPNVPNEEQLTDAKASSPKPLEQQQQQQKEIVPTKTSKTSKKRSSGGSSIFKGLIPSPLSKDASERSVDKETDGATVDPNNGASATAQLPISPTLSIVDATEPGEDAASASETVASLLPEEKKVEKTESSSEDASTGAHKSRPGSKEDASAPNAGKKQNGVYKAAGSVMSAVTKRRSRPKISTEYASQKRTSIQTFSPVSENSQQLDSQTNGEGDGARSEEDKSTRARKPSKNRSSVKSRKTESDKYANSSTNASFLESPDAHAKRIPPLIDVNEKRDENDADRNEDDADRNALSKDGEHELCIIEEETGDRRSDPIRSAGNGELKEDAVMLDVILGIVSVQKLSHERITKTIEENTRTLEENNAKTKEIVDGNLRFAQNHADFVQSSTSINKTLVDMLRENTKLRSDLDVKERTFGGGGCISSGEAASIASAVQALDDKLSKGFSELSAAISVLSAAVVDNGSKTNENDNAKLEGEIARWRGECSLERERRVKLECELSNLKSELIKSTAVSDTLQQEFRSFIENVKKEETGAGEAKYRGESRERQALLSNAQQVVQSLVDGFSSSSSVNKSGNGSGVARRTGSSVVRPGADHHISAELREQRFKENKQRYPVAAHSDRAQLERKNGVGQRSRVPVSYGSQQGTDASLGNAGRAGPLRRITAETTAYVAPGSLSSRRDTNSETDSGSSESGSFEGEEGEVITCITFAKDEA